MIIQDYTTAMMKAQETVMQTGRVVFVSQEPDKTDFRVAFDNPFGWLCIARIEPNPNRVAC